MTYRGAVATLLLIWTIMGPTLGPTLALESQPVTSPPESPPESLDQEIAGGTHGGGGGGVACYPPGVSRDGKSYTALLAWEFWDKELQVQSRLSGDFGYFQIDLIKAPEQYLYSVIPFINRLEVLWAPAFFDALYDAIAEVTSQLKQCRKFTHYTDDRGRRRAGEDEELERENCEPVQLAWRTPLAPVERERLGRDYKIEFNCELYDKLGFKDRKRDGKQINQAILILHEALYLMGARLGKHPTSVDIRALVNKLLRPAGIAEGPPSGVGKFKTHLRRFGFDDVFRLYKSDPKNPQDAIKLSRQRAYASVVKKIGDLRRKLFPLPPSSPLANPLRDSFFLSHPDYWYLDGLFNLLAPEAVKRADEFVAGLAQDVIPSLSDEEGFILAASLFSSMYFFDVEAGESLDHLLGPGLDESASLRRICGAGKYGIENYRLDRVLYPKIQNYCAWLRR